MTILITGSSGFIGTHLLKYFSKTNHTIYSISRDQGFDLSIPGWTKKIQIDSVEIVIHLAQSLNYRDFEKNSNDIFSVNVNSTQELLDWSKNHGVRKFIFTSSVNIYGSLYNKYIEEGDKLNYDSFYGLSKFLAEKLILFYSQYFDVLTLRLNTVYGPGQKGTLIPDIIKKITKNEKIYLGEDLGIMLSPIFVEDLVKIIYFFIITDKKIKHSVFNVSGPEKVSLKEIVRIISGILSTSPQIEVTSQKCKYFVSENNKLVSILSDQFIFTSIEQGLNLTCNKI